MRVLITTLFPFPNSRDSVPHRLHSYFHGNQELRQLSQQAEQLLALQRDYEQVAPPSLARASHVLKIDRQTLFIASGNGMIAAKLRQLAPSLTEQFQHMGYDISGVQVKVYISVTPPPPAPRPSSLSPAGRQELADFTLKLKDSPLKTALQRLATGNEPSN